MRHRAISQNIANVNTPGYKRREVSFEEELAKSLHLGSEAIEKIKPEVREVSTGHVRADGNNVDVDWEVSQLDKNAMNYEALTQILASKLSMLRSAITGR